MRVESERRSGDRGEKPNPHEYICNLVRQVICRMDEAQAEEVSARSVAALVAKKLDPRRLAPAELRFAAVEGLTQFARRELRRHDLPDADSPPEQIEAFARELQRRYSIERNGDRTYVLRELITKQEARLQIYPMLERARSAYDRHLDLFRKWNEGRPD